MVFWEAKGNRFTKTKWTMHEFQIATKSNPSLINNTTVSTIIKIEHCCIELNFDNDN